MRTWRYAAPLAVTLGLLVTPLAGAIGDGPPRQSPIRIVTGHAVRQELPELRFDYPPTTLRLEYVSRDLDDPDGCTHRDEEETVSGTVAAGAPVPALRVDETAYRLLNVHWHTPAEHWLNGRRYPLEQHLVHQGPDGELLVVAVFFRPGRDNEQLAELFDQLPAECSRGRMAVDVELGELIPTRTRSYRYGGSLTTEPHTEGVSWIVLGRAVSGSAAELDAFAEVFEEGNSRPLQPWNGRTVVTERR